MKNQPYYTCEMDIVHHIDRVFHVIPNGSSLPEREYPIFRTAETQEDFEYVYDAQFKKLKFRDQNLYLSDQINEFSQRVIELKMFDSHTFSEDIQLIHDYFNFLKGKEKKQPEEKTDTPEGNAVQKPDSIDSILRIIFPKESEKDKTNLTKSLRLLKENLEGSAHILSEFSNSLVYIGEIEGLENNVKMIWNLNLKNIHRKTVKAVFEQYVTISTGTAYIKGKKISFYNHI